MLPSLSLIPPTGIILHFLIASQTHGTATERTFPFRTTNKKINQCFHQLLCKFLSPIHHHARNLPDPTAFAGNSQVHTYSCPRYRVYKHPDANTWAPEPLLCVITYILIRQRMHCIALLDNRGHLSCDEEEASTPSSQPSSFLAYSRSLTS